MGNQTVHEDSNNVTCVLHTSISFHKNFGQAKINTCTDKNSWYRSSFIWTSTGTDGSPNYLEHWKQINKCMTITFCSENPN